MERYFCQEEQTHSSKFSIVIPTLNEGDLLRMTIESVLEQTEYPDFEIIIVDDGSTDGSTEDYRCRAYKDLRLKVVDGGGLGVAKARNRGAELAYGEFVVFLDAHCTVSPDWLTRFAAALNAPDAGLVSPTFTRLQETQPRGCGLTWIDKRLDTAWFEPLDTHEVYEVPLNIGACQAFRTSTFFAIGKYEEGFNSWGSEDLEICVRAWLLGYRVLADPVATVAHYFREERNYEVDDFDVTYNVLRMLHLHFSAPRIRKIIRQFKDIPDLTKALDSLYQSDIFEVRARLVSQQKRTDDWFCETFAPALA